MVEKKQKLLRDKVDFNAPIFHKFIEGQNRQVLKGDTRGKMVRLNRLPVLLMGSQINIVDHVRSFACNTLLLHCFTSDNSSVIQKKQKEIRTSTYNEIPIMRWSSGSSHKYGEKNLLKCQELVNHINFCMQNFTTHFMVGHHTSKDEDGKEIDQYEVVGVAIIEKNV